MTKVSVVIPVYKVEQYLRRCVDSILAQTFEDFDLILVDDGSPDNCPSICDGYASADARVHVIHQVNGGLSAARNAGIEWALAHSSSKYLAFVDSDDWVSCDYLAELMNGAGLGAEIACVSAVRTEGDAVKDADADDVWRLINPEEYWETAAHMNSSWGKIYVKRLFDSVRYPVKTIHEDEYVTYLLLFGQAKIAVCRKKLYYYYVRSGSITQGSWCANLKDAIPAQIAQCNYFKERRFDRAFKVSSARLLSSLAYLVRELSCGLHEYGDWSLTRARSALREWIWTARIPIVGNLFVWRMAYPVVFVPLWPIFRFYDTFMRGGVHGVLSLFKRKINGK